MGTLTFHPWPCTRDDVDHPDELRIDIDPQPGTTFTDARRVALVAGVGYASMGLTNAMLGVLAQTLVYTVLLSLIAVLASRPGENSS